MPSLKFALCLTCLFLGRTALTTTLRSSVHQECGFLSRNVGDNVTLRCFHHGVTATMIYWYKQTLGQRPQLMSIFYKHEKTGSFNGEFKNDTRLLLETKNRSYHLTISDLRISDSGTYYCIGCHSYKFDFNEGTSLTVKGSGLNIQALVHQSGTLNCTVYSRTCNGGKHSVYWFKSAAESHPGILYTRGGSNDQCVKNSTQTHTCFYNLPKKSQNLSQAETYCAVASCERMLFGNRTKQKDEVGSHDSVVYFLSGALAFTIILALLLVFSIFKTNNEKCFQQRESERISTSTPTNAEVPQDEDNLHYAALREHKVNWTRNQRCDSECVYSTVRH